jgi:hypothetical protein
MINLENLRRRYIKDSIPVRLAGLAANLLRIANFSKNANHREVVSSIVNESKWFIEWTAAELEVERAAELVGLQLLLASWDFQSHDRWQFEEWRSSLSAQARVWSERILQMSGVAAHKP